MTILEKLLTITREQDAGGTAPAPAAPAASEATGTSGATDRTALAGLFAAELDAEDKQQAPAKAEQPQTQELQTEEPADQDSAPETVSAAPAIEPPAGMSEADRAVWQQLSPEAQAWVSKRQSEQAADYTRKTQAVAEMRRHHEAATQQLMGQLQQYDSILSQITNRQIAPPDPALRNSDPLAFDEQMAAYITARHQQEVATAEQQRVRAHAQQVQQEQQTAWLSEQRTALADLATKAGVPVLAAGTDEGRKTREAVYRYAQSAGYTPEQLGMASATDLVTLYKAQQYDAAKAAKAAAKPVPAAVPKTTQPGPAKGQPNKGSLAAAITNLSQSGTRESLAAAYLAQINSER